MYHNHESDEFSIGEDFLEGFDYATEEDYDDGLEEGSIPECLKFPWSETEPVLSSEELSQIDAVAMQFEVDRLLGIPALERTSHALPGHKHLTTRLLSHGEPSLKVAAPSGCAVQGLWPVSTRSCVRVALIFSVQLPQCCRARSFQPCSLQITIADGSL